MGQEYLDFQIKKFTKASERFALKVGGIVAVGVSAIMFLPMYNSAGLEVFGAIAGISGMVIIFGAWFLGQIATENAIEFLRQLAHEEASRIIG